MAVPPLPTPSQQALVPPDALIKEHSGGIDRARFISMGEEIVTHSLIGFGMLQPGHRFLDVGCGCGKLARPLTGYLSATGRYDGIDITPEVIDWCRQAYRDHSNFRFHLADLYSERYNPRGAFKASNYRFPFPDDEFDLIFLGSVFTHMVPADTDNYLGEIARVLKPGGRCLATFFVLDDESRANAMAGSTSPAFKHAYGPEGCRVEVLSVPEAAIAYEEATVRRLYASHGLDITVMSWGEWGRKRLIPHWQDEVWSCKPTRS